MTLNVAHHLGGVLLYLVLVIVCPVLAKWLVSWISGSSNPHLCCRLLVVARLTAGLLVPLAVTIVFHNDCFATWIELWTVCANEQYGHVDMPLVPHHWPDNLVRVLPQWLLSPHNTYPVMRHDVVCGARWHSGRCSRAVIAVLADLVFDKLVVLAFAAPGLVMVLSLPAVNDRITRMCRWMYPRYSPSWYESDIELSFILIFIEQLLVLGFLVPLVLPLSAIAIAANCCVYHTGVETLNLPVNPPQGQKPPRPSLRYLFASHAIGCSLVIWFFVENMLSGYVLVCVGVPLSACLGYLLAQYFMTPQQMADSSHSQMLMECLLEEDGMVCESHDTHIEPSPDNSDASEG